MRETGMCEVWAWGRRQEFAAFRKSVVQLLRLNIHKVQR